MTPVTKAATGNVANVSIMWDRGQLVRDLQAARQERQQAEEEEERVLQQLAENSDETRRRELHVERSNLNTNTRRLEANRRIAHAYVLLTFLEHQYGTLEYEKNCKPAFAMSYTEVQDHLADWIVELLGSGEWYFNRITDSQRLLLAWCAQMLVVPNDSLRHPLYSDNFLNSTRSIYAFAISSEVAEPHMKLIGRGCYDARLMLALAAFPFLEGVVRRGLRTYMDENGTILTAFKVMGMDYSPAGAAEKGSKRCSNLSHALHKFEETQQPNELGKRLRVLRQRVNKVATSPATKAVSSQADLYGIIFDHRNSNLHGGTHVTHVGVASLLLATMIALGELKDKWEEFNHLARIVTEQRAPIRPDGVWDHIAFYPVEFRNTYRPETVHCWSR